MKALRRTEIRLRGDALTLGDHYLKELLMLVKYKKLNCCLLTFRMSVTVSLRQSLLKDEMWSKWAGQRNRLGRIC